MNKKNEDQGLLHFPTVFNLEPGGKSEVVPALDVDAPEWRKEVSKKVEEHKKMKELQENLKELKSLDRHPLTPEILDAERQKMDQRLAPERKEARGADLGRDGMDLQERERIKHFMESTGKTKAMLEDQHRQLFKDIEIVIDQHDPAQSGIAGLGADIPIALDEPPAARPTPAPPKPEPKRPQAPPAAGRPLAAQTQPAQPAAKAAPPRPAPPPVASPPDLAAEALKTALESSGSGKTKAQLESQHRLLFQDTEIQLDGEPGPVEEFMVEDPEKSRPETRSFADFDLAKNPLPDPHALAPEQAPAPPPAVETNPRGDYELPLAELLSRHEKMKAAEKLTPVADRTILVTRFLAGLIDFVLVGALSLAFLWLVTYVTGLGFFDSPMGFLLVVILLVIHVAYSYYFLVLLGQTLGMRMVGLQALFEREERLPPRVALLRTVFYLISVACLGLGLLWSVFDREAKCWQDILSESHVIRTS